MTVIRKLCRSVPVVLLVLSAGCRGEHLVNPSPSVIGENHVPLGFRKLTESEISWRRAARTGTPVRMTTSGPPGLAGFRNSATISADNLEDPIGDAEHAGYSDAWADVYAADAQATTYVSSGRAIVTVGGMGMFYRSGSLPFTIALWCIGINHCSDGDWFNSTCYEGKFNYITFNSHHSANWLTKSKSGDRDESDDCNSVPENYDENGGGGGGEDDGSGGDENGSCGPDDQWEISYDGGQTWQKIPCAEM